MALLESTKNSILSAMLGKTNTISIAPTCYIGLFTSAPTQNEILGTMVYYEPDEESGYARAQVGNYQNAAANAMENPTKGVSVNKSAIFFPEAVDTWGTVTHFGLFSTQTGGTPFLWGELSQGVTIPANYIPLFRAGSLTIKLT